MKQASGQMGLFDLDMPCGRTSPEHSLPTRAKTSASSSKSFAKSKTKAPMFLDLSGGGGNLAGVSWETGIPWHGASSMLNFGESPSVVEESGLSQILEDSAPLKYYLSARACSGVLRRAEKRGKKLPEILETALKQQIERWEKYGTPAKCLDTSNGDPTKNQGGNVVVEKYAANSSGGDIASTIDAHYYLGCGARGGKEREFVAIAIDRAAFNQGENAKFDMGVDTNGIAFSCVAKGPGAVCYEETRTCYVVRRLTPLECCRLQGMPDWWCADVPHSDAQEYRMWGNGMALPNALYIMEGLVENDER